MTTQQQQSLDLVGKDLANGRYHVVDKLGEGSMGYVYRAMDSRLETEVVIKIPMRAGMEDDDFRFRFRQESQLLTKLFHPHIVRIIDTDHGDEGPPYVVMQYLSGGTLRDRMYSDSGELTGIAPETLNTWLREVAKALDFVHGQSIIHRDVKPANIIYDEHGNAFLSDFGLTKILDKAAEAAGLTSSANSTAAGYVVGTPNYVAPELVMGHEYDGRADQYSLAITVYEVLTGKPPLEGPTASATMVNQTNKMPPPLSQVDPKIPRGVSTAVQKALAKNPNQRFASCVEFAEHVLAGLHGGATLPSTHNTSTKATSPTQQKTAAPVATPQEEVNDDSSSSGVQSAVYTGIMSTGPKGKVPCPKCQKKLPIKTGMGGFRARCAHCQSILEIGHDLASLKLMKEPEIIDDYDDFDDSVDDTARNASGQTMKQRRPPVGPGRRPPSRRSSGGKRPPSARRKKGGKKARQEMVLEEEVFGWKISKGTAAFVGSMLMLMAMSAGMFFLYKYNNTSEKELDERTNQYQDQEERRE